ncbi:hypothetical protein TIFTF001_009542 [Ficus carica]|uniref:Uncharacterized protein n=1 Tax=Ficus carica TaxID=3494 RepID=A0AA87ZUV5_FICCA|nr:hypothetical protein TIFTF001_009542 [Ficus carica]
MEHSKKGRARRKNPLDPNVDGKRRATIMKHVHMARKRGERIQVTFDEKGQLEGKHGDELMSWIGVLALEHVPIWIQDWRSRDLDGLKEIIWKEIVTSFTVDDCFRNTCFKLCSETARNFRHDLYKTLSRNLTSSQFQQLSDRRRKIRTNNEYSSRGGRDGYRKLDQENFKKTGKWERRDGLWLERQTCADGKLKDPACKKVSELIMEYNTQESQGTFELVVTSYVLLHALSRSEHKGRVRGQSKFALVHGLCANKDVEPSVDPNNVPTVDQHNSFKASCSAQEKQHGVSDPPTMPVDSCLLRLEEHGWEAFPPIRCMGFHLGKGTCELVEIDTGMNKASRGPSHVPDPAAGKKKMSKKSLKIKQSTLRLRYLVELCRINGQAEKFAFVSPTLISPVRTDTEDAGMRDRADNHISFLRDAPKGQLYPVPHNRGRHLGH